MGCIFISKDEALYMNTVRNLLVRKAECLEIALAGRKEEGIRIFVEPEAYGLIRGQRIVFEFGHGGATGRGSHEAVHSCLVGHLRRA